MTQAPKFNDMVLHLGFANLALSDDRLSKVFESKIGLDAFSVFGEVSDTGKEHQHFIIKADKYKVDTIRQWITTIPELKAERKGRGGSHEYTVKEFPKQYEKEPAYPEQPVDYQAKDNNLLYGNLVKCKKVAI